MKKGFDREPKGGGGERYHLQLCNAHSGDEDGRTVKAVFSFARREDKTGRNLDSEGVSTDMGEGRTELRKIMQPRTKTSRKRT